MTLLDDDSVEVASVYPFQDLSHVQHFKHADLANRSIQQVLHRALNGNAEVYVPLLQSVFNRLERDENALNWVFHNTLVNSFFLAGNDLNVIDFIKKMPSASKLSLVAMFQVDRGIAFHGDKYKNHLDAALAHVCELCSEEGVDGFKILPTDLRLLCTAPRATLGGDPGVSAINYNASSVRTLPKTILFRLRMNSLISNVSQNVANLMREFPLASGLREEIMKETYTPRHEPLFTAINKQFQMKYGGNITLDDLISPVQPVAGGYYRPRLRLYSRFASFDLMESNDGCVDSQKFISMISHLYAMGDWRLSDPVFISSEQNYDEKLMSLERKLAATPGIPSLNNFTRATPDGLSFELIDEYLDSNIDTVIASCAYQGPEHEGTDDLTKNFLTRLADQATNQPKGVFYQYGLVRLALEAKDFLQRNGNFSLDDLGLDSLCDVLRLDEQEPSVVFSHRVEIFDRLPARMRTMENKVFLGLSLAPHEIESCSEALKEKALSIDLGL